MYKFVVVTDPDTATGFRLAGVDVLESPNPDEVAALLPSLLLRDDTGIIAINEEYMMSLDDKMMEKIEKSYRPIIIPIPSKAKRVPLEQVGLGLLISIVASLINLGVALVLLRAGKRYGSITLEADARHLLTDVWTTVGVLVVYCAGLADGL